MGFVRGDGTPAVLYAGFDQGIHELALVGGKWMATALSQAANAPKLKDMVGGPMRYVRGDGVTVVVYHGDDDHIHELKSVGDNWVHSDLFLLATGALGEGTPTARYPFAYVRSDGVSSILWVGPAGQIHQLALSPA